MTDCPNNNVNDNSQNKIPPSNEIIKDKLRLKPIFAVLKGNFSIL
jgi:hypothetical protein